MVGRAGTSIPGAVFFIGLLIVAAIDISYIHMDWGPFNRPEMIRSVTLHQEYYTMDNALGLARLYLGTALRYSMYQAMYDNGRRGGFPGGEAEMYNTYALWYDNGDTHPDEQALLENLEGPALAGLGRYLESDYVFLDDYAVKLPQYTGLEIQKTPEGEILAKAAADRNLWIRRVMQNLDEVELEKKANLEEGFGEAYLGLYQRSAEQLGAAKEKFGEIMGLLGQVKEGSLTREQEGSPPRITELEVFLEALEGIGISGVSTKEEGEAGLRGMFQGILDGLEDIPGEVVFSRFISFVVSSFSESEDCPDRQTTSRTEGGKTIYITTMTCTFRYNYDFFAGVSVTDNSGKEYPVFDAGENEIVFRPLALAFGARECNLDECLKNLNI